jgi:hypothetical protein
MSQATVYYKPDEESHFHLGRTGETFERFKKPSGTHKHLLRGPCEHQVEDDNGTVRQCQHDAAYRLLGDYEYHDLCGLHAPDSWTGEAPITRNVIAFAEHSCDAVTDSHRVQRGGGHIEADAGRCGDQGFIAFVRDGEVKESYCLRHCRSAWRSDLLVETDE